MQVKIKKLDESVITPIYATLGAACFDLHAYESHPISIDPKNAVEIRTGLFFEIPRGYVMEVKSRSGHGFKYGVRLANCEGIIDSDYRGEVKVKLRNDGVETFIVNPKDRIAQAMIIPVQQVQFEEVEELSDTVRGTGGFGSSGK